MLLNRYGLAINIWLLLFIAVRNTAIISIIKVSAHDRVMQSIERIRALGTIDSKNVFPEVTGIISGFMFFFPQCFIGMTYNVVRQFASVD